MEQQETPNQELNLDLGIDMPNFELPVFDLELDF